MLKKILAACLIFCMFCASAQAQMRQWVIDPEKSTVRFTATQNNAPVEGKFEHIQGEISFDKEKVKSSSVKAMIPLNGLVSTNKEVADMLKTNEWLNVAHFPNAVFASKAFRSIGGNQYEAEGELTLRGKALPLTLTFNLTEYTDKTAAAKGKSSVKRTAYGVGQGAWMKTDAIKDDVEITVDVVATRK